MDRTPTLNCATRLDQITTVFQNLDDPAKFVLAYAGAVRRYFLAILRDSDEAEEAIQDFLVKIVQSGFGEIRPERGRFRDYLKAAVRNAAITRMRRSSSARPDPEEWARERGETGYQKKTVEREWRHEWRRCVVERAWRSLENHQNHTPRNLSYTALRLVSDHPREDSKQLALRASANAKESVTADAFRKQLSRGRRVFARLLLSEVAATLKDPSPDQVEEELRDLGLMQYVRDFLPADWRSSGALPSFE